MGGPTSIPGKLLGGALCCLAAAAGCQTGVLPDCTTGCADSESEPNNTFQSARVVVVPNTTRITLAGAIDYANDVDVFNLGPAAAGDRVNLSLRQAASSLRGMLALYDDEGELINEDTLTSELFSASGPAIAHIVREDTARVYAAVTHIPARTTGGAYELDVRIIRGGTAPQPVAQVVLLNFAGDVVDDPLFGRYETDPFSAGDISQEYADATELMKTIIRDTFAQNYERFAVEIWDSDDAGAADALAGRSYARVVFGGFNAYAFGAAQAVDAYNQEPADAAIIFTESFEPYLFPMTPTAEQLAIAIGNVASHEMGHLLGLHHVVDATAIMDEASPAYTLLDDQEFKSAPLSASIFPLGRQDSAALLGVILGWRAGLPKITDQPELPLTAALEAATARTAYVEPDAATPVRGKCLNCLWRRALAGQGPLKNAVRPGE